MNGDKSGSSDLFDLENRLTASLLRIFQSLLLHGASRVDNTASVGQAAYNAMATDVLMNQMVKSVEELLSLTRKMRELWVVGGLKKPGEGDDEVDDEIKEMWELLRERERLLRSMRGVGEYKEGEVKPPVMPQVNAGVGQQQQQQVGQVAGLQSGNATPSLGQRMGMPAGQGGQGGQGGQSNVAGQGNVGGGMMA
ncbi:hypothetical protein B0T20DRAFT_452733 [Sordaria brevicollis]|uniref:Mediator of RNA polymerase II transcription subunit 22 n=1 Tax=Sordaria brevicollis TaxID=83679 RepID=A0AAE0UCZ2_SORBR|nr:hypothetical protein B0T20DRAFT_452733 [Sordaria brevicollis]